MIINLKFYNYITNKDDKLIIEYPEINYETWKRTKDYNDDNDICNILNDILNNINCAKGELGGCRLCMTSYPMYKIFIQKYYYYLTKIKDQFIYNQYLDKLIYRHRYNIIFEYLNPINKESKTIKSKTAKKVSNKYKRYITKDIFTNEDIYLYINPKTNHEIRSTNPNLLDELNNIKKKIKKEKDNGVPLSAMTFNFKK